MSEDKGLIVGIDIGNCNVKAAVQSDKKKRIEIHKFNKAQGVDVIPNKIEIRENGVFVGKIKKSKKMDQDIVSNVKKHLSEENWKTYSFCRGKDLTAIELITEELVWIKNNIETFHKAEISEAVLTVPVCFSELQKNRLKSAAASAGINVKEIVTEPFAAMFSCKKLIESDDEKKVMIFDFGGGTLDISIFSVSGDDEKTKIETLSSRGVNFGGNDITDLIYKDKIKEEYGEKIQQEIFLRVKHSLLDSDMYSDEDKKTNSDMYKKHYLFHSEQVNTEVADAVAEMKELVCESDDGSGYCSFESMIYNDELNSVMIDYTYDELTDLLDKSGIRNVITDTLDELVDAAMIDKSDVSKVIMTGGTSKIAYFRNMLCDYFELDENSAEEVIEETDNDQKFNAVCYGAAVYALLDEDKFTVINRLSFEIGMIGKNGRYTRLMDINAAYNSVPSLKRPIELQERDADTYKLNIYQIFFDSTQKSVNVDNDLIYMGCLVFDKKIYEKKKMYFIELSVDGKGVLTADIYDENGSFIEKLNILMEE